MDWSSFQVTSCGFNDPAILTGTYNPETDQYDTLDGTISRPNCNEFVDRNLDILPKAIVPANLPNEQFVEFYFDRNTPEKVNVRSALITTDESKMSGCRLKFTIDDGVEVVPDNGVGVDGIGGLFNMNVDTNVFRVEATNGACSPFFALIEVQLYIYPVLTFHPSLSVPS